MFRRAATSILGNAMFWKDITQWLHSGRFAMLFFGLLLLGEAGALMTFFTPADNARQGRTLFFFSDWTLTLYMLAVATVGYGQTSTELKNGLFEFYVLTGIRGDMVIWGKLYSMLAQFLLGACCLGPYLFLACMMGGLGVHEILGCLISLCFWSVPVYLFSLMRAFQTVRAGLFRSLLRIGCLGMLLMFCLPLLAMFFAAMTDLAMASSSPISASLMRNILAREIDAVGIAIILCFLYLYAFIFLFAFCENALIASVPALASQFVLRHWQHPPPAPAEPPAATASETHPEPSSSGASPSHSPIISEGLSESHV